MGNLENVDKVTNLHKRNELQLLCFRLEKGGNIYAVNVFKIKEVVKYNGSITLVNHDRSNLLEGLITMRELTIPLIDMRKWFNYDVNHPEVDISHKAVQYDENTKHQIIMICDFSRYMVGVRIYEADRILSKSWNEIEQSAGVGSRMKSNNAKLVSRTRYFDGSIVQVVDIEKMLTDVFPWIEAEKNEEMEKLERIVSDKVVLIADDSPSVLHTMRNILVKLGLEFKEFVNGQLLLDFLYDPNVDLQRIGLIITDLEMPEASGFEVIKQVKNDPKLSHIPVVVNSSMSGSSNEEMARSLNADEFISKSNPGDIEMIAKRHMETAAVTA